MLSAQATLESARERRESRGCHVGADFPGQDAALLVNLTWRPDGSAIVHEPVGRASAAIEQLALAPELEVAGRLLE